MPGTEEGNQKRIKHFKEKHYSRDMYIVRSIETNPTIKRVRIAEVCNMSKQVLNQWVASKKQDGYYYELLREIS